MKEKKSKWVNINYIESILSKQWMDKHLGAQGKSKFIREAVETKIKNKKIKVIV